MPFSPGYHATYMPRCGSNCAGSAGRESPRLAHEKSVARELGKLLDELEPYLRFQRSEPLTRRKTRLREGGQSALRITWRASVGAAAYDAWKRANAGERLCDHGADSLKRAIDLGREYADFFAPYEHVADPLIDYADEGMTTASTSARSFQS